MHISGMKVASALRGWRSRTIARSGPTRDRAFGWSVLVLRMLVVRRSGAEHDVPPRREHSGWSVGELGKIHGHRFVRPFIAEASIEHVFVIAGMTFDIELRREQFAVVDGKRERQRQFATRADREIARLAIAPRVQAVQLDLSLIHISEPTRPY